MTRFLAVAALTSLATLAAQTQAPLSIAIVDPRPVAKAVALLEARYGWVVTYEDPPYEHDREIEDITATRDRRPPSPVIIPRGGSLEFRYDRPDPDPSVVLPMLVQTHRGGGQGSSFAVTRSDGIFHVVPARLLTRTGEVVEHRSILAVTVSLPAGARSVAEAIDLVLQQVSAAAGRGVGLAGVANNGLRLTRFNGAMSPQSAEAALTQLLNATGGVYSWQLLFDPGGKVYLLSLHSAQGANGLRR